MQKRFLQDVMLFVLNGILSLMIVEYVWFQILVMQLCLKVKFLFRMVYIEEVLLALVNMALTKCVQPTLPKCLTTTCIFY